MRAAHRIDRTAVSILGALMVLIFACVAHAHGYAGKRFFPTTFQVDDPFISDEFSILLDAIKQPRSGQDPPVRTTEVDAAWSKRLTPRFGFEFDGNFRHYDRIGGPVTNGFGNFEVGAKYEFVDNAPHEAIVSAGLSAEVGGTGSSRVGAESVSVVSPGFFFGKGFGDLPDRLGWLQPLALTGAVSLDVPTDARTVTTTRDPMTGLLERDVELNPTNLSWGLTLQYNLPYLQAFVKDVGLPNPIDRMIPLVEFAMSSCLNRGCGGQTTGTVNPGVVWIGRNIELGLAAQIPVNPASGHTVGALVLVHLFVDDLLPRSLGRPLFGN